MSLSKAGGAYINNDNKNNNATIVLLHLSVSILDVVWLSHLLANVETHCQVNKHDFKMFTWNMNFISTIIVTSAYKDYAML
jgi:hypothetical protein